MDDNFASYPCCVCAAQAGTPLHCLRGFQIVRCACCGLVYVEPRLRDERLFDLYRQDYFRPGSETGYWDYELTASMRRATFRKWYGELERYLPPGRAAALDIGCAAGYFLEVLRTEGWQRVEGIELNWQMVQQLRGRGWDISESPLEHFVPRRRYGLITLFDVLEHLPGINEDFVRLAAMLEVGGVLALVTPNFNSLQRRLLGRRWFQFKPREHLYYFAPPTLRRMAEKHGFAVECLHACGQFADVNVLRDRFRRYQFPLLGRLLGLAGAALPLAGKRWYVDTASMFAVLKKRA